MGFLVALYGDLSFPAFERAAIEEYPRGVGHSSRRVGLSIIYSAEQSEASILAPPLGLHR